MDERHFKSSFFLSRLSCAPGKSSAVAVWSNEEVFEPFLANRPCIHGGGVLSMSKTIAIKSTTSINSMGKD